MVVCDRRLLIGMKLLTRHFTMQGKIRTIDLRIYMTVLSANNTVMQLHWVHDHCGNGVLYTINAGACQCRMRICTIQRAKSDLLL